jgi:hypothetical protein
MLCVCVFMVQSHAHINVPVGFLLVTSHNAGDIVNRMAIHRCIWLAVMDK